MSKVLILDWDAHHGNGTQNAFYDDPLVFYISLHEYPHFPGTGKRADTGINGGKGFTKIFPLSSGSGDKECLSFMENEICPMILNFNPELIIISAGFDAHVNDPLASLAITSEGFREMTKLILDVADKVCDGRIVSILEGGYNLNALGESVGFHVLSLLNL